MFARFKNEKPDFPWLRYNSPWDVRIDPIAQSFDPDQSPRWVAFRDIYCEPEVKKSGGLIKRKDWKPTYIPAPFARAEEQNRRRGTGNDAPLMYEAWTVFDASERKMFSLGTGADREVREAQDWPIEWGQLPYSILTLNEQLDTPIGIPYPKLYANEQAAYNRDWTILNTIISRTLRCG